MLSCVHGSQGARHEHHGTRLMREKITPEDIPEQPNQSLILPTHSAPRKVRGRRFYPFSTSRSCVPVSPQLAGRNALRPRSGKHRERAFPLPRSRAGLHGGRGARKEGQQQRKSDRRRTPRLRPQATYQQLHRLDNT